MRRLLYSQACADLVGFYSDARGGDGVSSQTANTGTFDNLRVVDFNNTASVFTVAGDFTLDSTATLAVDLVGHHEYGKIVVEGAFHAGGTLHVDLAAGFQPIAGDSFDILDFGADTGSFDLRNCRRCPLA